MGHVLRYYRRFAADWRHIREAEVDVSLVKDEYTLAGPIDLIAGQGATVELVGFETERKLDVNDPADRPRLDRYRRQLEVYAHLVEERYGLDVSRTYLNYTGERSGNPRSTFDNDSRVIHQTNATFDEVVGRIERHDYAIPERPVKLCRECDMRHYRDAKTWSFRRPR